MHAPRQLLRSYEPTAVYFLFYFVPFLFFGKGVFAFSEYFVPFIVVFLFCMEGTLYVSFRKMVFQLVITGWMLTSRENECNLQSNNQSINQSNVEAKTSTEEKIIMYLVQFSPTLYC